MKYIRNVFAFLLILMLINEGEVVAMNTGFSTGTLSKNDIETFIENVNISILENEPQRQAIECFDVDEEGTIAIGYSDSQNKTVCIYTNNGDFQYGYSFECSGKFGIEIHNRVLNIYFVRSDVAIAINSKGEIESILEIKNTSDNYNYWNNHVFLTKRKIGDNEYILKNDMGIFNVFASSYSQLIITNKNGEKSIMYDVNSTQFSNMVIKFIGVLVFICLVIAIVFGQFIKQKRGI